MSLEKGATSQDGTISNSTLSPISRLKPNKHSDDFLGKTKSNTKRGTAGSVSVSSEKIFGPERAASLCSDSNDFAKGRDVLSHVSSPSELKILLGKNLVEQLGIGNAQIAIDNIEFSFNTRNDLLVHDLAT
ncbi:hypothetical protein RRG08_004691 [Elysia crispata]|uniref:Uncharacterized protein n=1 Tax=Elysia crispata TaxID=231223 RepID=A0AAE1B0H3_9GAST|nr:hypothetical protein RRG08_004691 [Elysia crispata]